MEEKGRALRKVQASIRTSQHKVGTHKGASGDACGNAFSPAAGPCGRGIPPSPPASSPSSQWSWNPYPPPGCSQFHISGIKRSHEGFVCSLRAKPLAIPCPTKLQTVSASGADGRLQSEMEQHRADADRLHREIDAVRAQVADLQVQLVKLKTPAPQVHSSYHMSPSLL